MPFQNHLSLCFVSHTLQSLLHKSCQLPFTVDPALPVRCHCLTLVSLDCDCTLRKGFLLSSFSCLVILHTAATGSAAVNIHPVPVMLKVLLRNPGTGLQPFCHLTCCSALALLVTSCEPLCSSHISLWAVPQKYQVQYELQSSDCQTCLDKDACSSLLHS